MSNQISIDGAMVGLPGVNVTIDTTTGNVTAQMGGHSVDLQSALEAAGYAAERAKEISQSVADSLGLSSSPARDLDAALDKAVADAKAAAQSSSMDKSTGSSDHSKGNATTGSERSREMSRAVSEFVPGGLEYGAPASTGDYGDGESGRERAIGNALSFGVGENAGRLSALGNELASSKAETAAILAGVEKAAADRVAAREAREASSFTKDQVRGLLQSGDLTHAQAQALADGLQLGKLSLSQLGDLVNGLEKGTVTKEQAASIVDGLFGSREVGFSSPGVGSAAQAKAESSNNAFAPGPGELGTPGGHSERGYGPATGQLAIDAQNSPGGFGASPSDGSSSHAKTSDVTTAAPEVGGRTAFGSNPGFGQAIAEQEGLTDGWGIGYGEGGWGVGDQGKTVGSENAGYGAPSGVAQSSPATNAFDLASDPTGGFGNMSNDLTAGWGDREAARGNAFDSAIGRELGAPSSGVSDLGSGKGGSASGERGSGRGDGSGKSRGAAVAGWDSSDNAFGNGSWGGGGWGGWGNSGGFGFGDISNANDLGGQR